MLEGGSGQEGFVETLANPVQLWSGGSMVGQVELWICKRTNTQALTGPDINCVYNFWVQLSTFMGLRQRFRDSRARHHQKKLEKYSYLRAIHDSDCPSVTTYDPTADTGPCSVNSAPSVGSLGELSTLGSLGSRRGSYRASSRAPKRKRGATEVLSFLDPVPVEESEAEGGDCEVEGLELGEVVSMLIDKGITKNRSFNHAPQIETLEDGFKIYHYDTFYAKGSEPYAIGREQPAT